MQLRARREHPGRHSLARGGAVPIRLVEADRTDRFRL
jgi:hypothetical protein